MALMWYIVFSSDTSLPVKKKSYIFIFDIAYNIIFWLYSFKVTPTHHHRFNSFDFVSFPPSCSHKLVTTSCQWLSSGPENCCLHSVVGWRIGQIMHTAGGSTVSWSVSFKDRHTHTCIHKHTLSSLSASDNIAQWTRLLISRVPSRVGSGTAASANSSSQRHQSRTVSVLRCVTVSSPRCSHNPACPAASSPTTRHRDKTWEWMNKPGECKILQQHSNRELMIPFVPRGVPQNSGPYTLSMGPSLHPRLFIVVSLWALLPQRNKNE